MDPKDQRHEHPTGLAVVPPPNGTGPTGTAVLLIHGFTSTPASVMPWARACAEVGHTVVVPTLPGHGTTWQDLAGTTAEDWTAAVEAAYDDLAAEHHDVAVCGLSMGGALALHLGAVRRPVAVYVTNPALSPYPFATRLTPLLKHALASVEGIGGDIAKPGAVETSYDRVPLTAVHQLVRLQRRVRGELPGIVAPVTLLRSDEDHVVSDASVAALRRGLRDRVELTVVPLHRSLHVATLDHDADLIAETTLTDLARRTHRNEPQAAPGGRHRGGTP